MTTGSLAPRIGLLPVRVRDAGGGELLVARERYVAAVRAAGGLPLLLPAVDAALAEQLVLRVDGVLLPGGRDLPPALYGDAAEPELEAVLEDDLAQAYLAAARSALAGGVPLLGVCLGLQVANVALGGTLLQHLRPKPDGPLHRGPGETDARHAVELDRSSRLGRAIGIECVEVVSHHHQAIRTLAPGLRAVGWSPDGLCEAFEHAEHPFFVGVQWHPERQFEEAAGFAPFRAFAAAARARAMDRGSGPA